MYFQVYFQVYSDNYFNCDVDVNKTPLRWHAAHTGSLLDLYLYNPLHPPVWNVSHICPINIAPRTLWRLWRAATLIKLWFIFGLPRIPLWMHAFLIIVCEFHIWLQIRTSQRIFLSVWFKCWQNTLEFVIARVFSPARKKSPTKNVASWEPDFTHFV